MYLLMLSILFILVTVILFTFLYKKSKHRYNTDFFMTKCNYNDCKTCTEHSGCSWCPKRGCIDSTLLKPTDKECNPINAIGSSFLCTDQKSPKVDMNETIYHDQIKEKVKPPNVYLTDNKEYTPETVMGNLNEVRESLKRYQMDLPGIVATSVQDNIKPMVKGMIRYH
jgi:hypothetical protein